MDRAERRLIILCAILVAITLTAWGASGQPTNWAIIAIVALAFLKVRYVVLDFMEVREAPLALRAVLEVWVVATPIAIIAMLFYR